jgi:hypothetical protein
VETICEMDLDIDGKNIEMCLRKVRRECVGWIHLSQDSCKFDNQFGGSVKGGGIS